MKDEVARTIASRQLPVCCTSVVQTVAVCGLNLYILHGASGISALGCGAAIPYNDRTTPLRNLVQTSASASTATSLEFEQNFLVNRRWNCKACWRFASQTLSRDRACSSQRFPTHRFGTLHTICAHPYSSSILLINKDCFTRIPVMMHPTRLRSRGILQLRR